MNWSVEQIAGITRGVLRGRSGVQVQGVSTDTRTLKAGDLFVALRGDNFDGHQFLNQAVSAGAVACLVEASNIESAVPLIVVENTLTALGDLAANLRKGFDGPVVAITGTSGKTSTKEMVAAILETTGKGLKTSGNFNNLIGLPLTLFGLTPEHQWLVLEMGMNRRGEIARLSEIASPTIGLVTNVGEGHLEGLGGVEGVARAKGELFAAIPAGGIAVVNCDDARVMQLPVANGVKRLTYGIGLESLDISARVIEMDARGSRIELATGEERIELRIEAPGAHQVENAVAAAAVGKALNVPLNKIAQGLEAFRPASGRMQPQPLGDEMLLLDDTYNANPLSMRSALETLKNLESGDGRFAVLGDMLELGAESAELHREIGRYAAGCVDALVALGEHAADLTGAAAEAGLDAKRIFVARSHEEAVEKLLVWLQHGANILVKGSRGMRMEQVCELLKARLGNGEAH